MLTWDAHMAVVSDEVGVGGRDGEVMARRAQKLREIETGASGVASSARAAMWCHQPCGMNNASPGESRASAARPWSSVFASASSLSRSS